MRNCASANSALLSDEIGAELSFISKLYSVSRTHGSDFSDTLGSRATRTEKPESPTVDGSLREGFLLP